MNEQLYNIDLIRKTVEQFLNIVLSETVTIGEIPAPTFSESQRSEYIANRFTEAGLQDCFMDEKGNVAGIIPGASGSSNILVSSYMDTLYNNEIHIAVTKDHLTGPFLGNNALGLATITTLPFLIEKLNIKLDSNLHLLSSPISLGRGNNEGLKHFLSNSKTKFNAGIVLENTSLGRLNYSAIGMLTCEITCHMPEDFNWEKYGHIGTIIPISEVINKIANIALPKIPFSTIILGSVNGGFTYNNLAKKTVLRFEVRSESFDILKSVHEQIKNITDEVSARSGMKIFLEVLSQREPGGLDIGHEILHQVRSVFNSLGIKPDFFPTVSQLSVIKDFEIPCLTLGVTSKESAAKADETDDVLNISAIPLGITQVIASLIAIDKSLNKNKPSKGVNPI